MPGAALNADVVVGTVLQLGMSPLPPPVSCLSPDGELLVPEPPLSDDQALAAYQCMLTGRRFDERCVSLQRRGRMVTLAPGVGQEAATVGAAMALDKTTDWFVPQYRELAGQLWHGYPLRLAFLWHMGHPIAFRTPDGVNMLPFQAAVAGQIPQAVGLAWGLRLQAKKAVVLVVFGDGATSEGDFHEAANIAGVVKAPVVLLCQNNGWAIATPVEAQTASATIAQKAIAYGMPGVQCDGNDIFAVYTAVKWAVERARRGDGPALVEALTYRLGLHTTADDPTRYLPEGEAKSWAPRDPLIRLRRYLERRGRTADELDAIDREVAEDLKLAWEEAQREAAPDPREYFEHVFAAVPARLRAQLDEADGG